MASSPHTAARMVWGLPQASINDGWIPPRRLPSPLPSPFACCPSPSMAAAQKHSSLLLSSRLSPPPPPPPPSAGKISPAVIFVVVILAVIFFICGLLHLFVRFLTRQGPPPSPQDSPFVREIPGSYALQRQLQQLFHLHDAGLDQASIDALPVFLYMEVVGPKEPSDCAVCLCEFADEDRLRLLPACSHAFHMNCIDTWLLSSSTCPLCREKLFVPGLAVDNPVFDFDDSIEEVTTPPPPDGGVGFQVPGAKPADLEEGRTSIGNRVFSVRLGKFRSLSGSDGSGDGVAPSKDVRNREAEQSSSSSNIDARRCYSMGSYQYVVGNSDLQVALSASSNANQVEYRETGRRLAADGDRDRKRLWAGSRDESFSISKIWQWPVNKGRFSSSSDTSSVNGVLPWTLGNARNTYN